jgi:hypothetical protein
MGRPNEIQQRNPDGLTIAIGVSHWIVFVMLFGYAWGYGVTQHVPPIWLEPLTWLLGSPMIPLLLLGSLVVTGDGGKLLIDNVVLLIGISVLNSMLWAAGIGWIIQLFWRRRRL